MVKFALGVEVVYKTIQGAGALVNGYGRSFIMEW